MRDFSGNLAGCKEESGFAQFCGSRWIAFVGLDGMLLWVSAEWICGGAR